MFFEGRNQDEKLGVGCECGRLDSAVIRTEQNGVVHRMVSNTCPALKEHKYL